MLNVRVAGISFEGSPTGDAAYVISPDGWSGWDDGPDVRRDEVVRPNGHGSFPVPGLRAARVVSISGWILARSPWELQEMTDRLKGVLADGGSGTVTVERPNGTRWANIFLTAAPLVRVHGASETAAEFQIQFWSPDPRQFGDYREFSGSGTVTVQNRGNFPATPVIEVSGTLAAGYEIRSQGRTYNVTQALASGQTHRIDMATGWLYRNGTLQVGAVAITETFTIPAGSSKSVVFDPVTGSGSMKVKLHDTFV